MEYKVFSIYDSKIGSYARPFPMHTVGQALRAFSDLINEPGSDPSKHPEDFTLFELGTYDEKTGKFNNNPTPTSLGVAIEFHEATQRAHAKSLTNN